MKKETLFFIKSTVNYKNSSKGGGYFKYSDVESKDCLLTITGNVCTIYGQPIAAGYVLTENKMLTGKYFTYSGKKVTEKTFEKHLKVRYAAAKQMKAKLENKYEVEALNAANLLREVKEKITSNLTPEKIESWTAEGANEGNSHTRRTRWANRAERMGVKGYGSTLRDMTGEGAKLNPAYFVDGKYNNLHI